MDSEAIRDKYADEPPPDHLRYTGGLRPIPKPEIEEKVQNMSSDANATLSAADAAVADIEAVSRPLAQP